MLMPWVDFTSSPTTKPEHAITAPGSFEFVRLEGDLKFDSPDRQLLASDILVDCVSLEPSRRMGIRRRLLNCRAIADHFGARNMHHYRSIHSPSLGLSTSSNSTSSGIGFERHNGTCLNSACGSRICGFEISAIRRLFMDRAPGRQWYVRTYLALLVLSLPSLSAAAKFETTDTWENDPPIPPRVKLRLEDTPYKPLWLRALARPEVELRRLAAESIARAHRMGFPGLEDTADPLMKLLSESGESPRVRIAAARALVALNASQAAPGFFEHVRSANRGFCEVAEPALARWRYEPMRAVWLERLQDSGTSHRQLMLAIDGLSTFREEQAIARLSQLAMSQVQRADVRLRAARGLGNIQRSGLEETAGTLAGRNDSLRIVDRLVAASLLRHHSGSTAQDLLMQLAVDAEPAIAVIALQRLLEIDSKLVLPLAEKVVRNPDPKVRMAGIQALAANPTEKRFGILTPLLADRHPSNRRFVRSKLVEHARFERGGQRPFRDTIIDRAKLVLASNQWRGLEQSLLLFVELSEKTVTERALELLDFDRPEVYITAAWALRKMAVPATHSAMFGKANRLTVKFRAMGINDDLDHQLGQLFQAFGEAKFFEAVPLMSEFIPKNLEMGEQSRGSAIWALGRFHVDEPEPTLARKLEGRLGDVMGIPAETGLVRAMSAVSLGRMKSPQSLGTFRKVIGMEGIEGAPGYFSAWAIHQITGAPIPKQNAVAPIRGDWFLQPLGNPTGS